MRTDTEIVRFLKELLPLWIELCTENEEMYRSKIMVSWCEGRRQMAEQVLKIVNNEE